MMRFPFETSDDRVSDWLRQSWVHATDKRTMDEIDAEIATAQKARRHIEQDSSR